MDLLSRLLALTPVSGTLDVRCHFGAPWHLQQGPAAPDEMPYHVLLEGEAVLDDPQGPGHTPLQAGDIVLFPQGQAHALHDGSGRTAGPVEQAPSRALSIARNDGPGAPADILCGRFRLQAPSGRLLRDFLPPRLIVSSRPAPGEADDGRLARLVGLMREEALEEGPGSAAVIGHLSAALFALALRHASRAHSAPRGVLALARHARLQPALMAMFDRPEHGWTLPELAALCHLSRATLLRQFQEVAGRSPAGLLLEIRMARAMRLLAQPGPAVAAVGEAVGYQSEAAFQRAFKRLAGQTPAKWRAATLRQASPPGMARRGGA